MRTSLGAAAAALSCVALVAAGGASAAPAPRSIFAALFAGAGAAARPSRPHHVRRHACPIHSFEGLASFYDRASSGKITANGEVFNDRAMTAAHPCLPFGTTLRVCTAAACVTVRINDRGPAAWTGRVLDVSRGVAAELGMIGAGVVRITAEAIFE